jgi:uncharacterized protein involved in tolerance to divalent cations
MKTKMNISNLKKVAITACVALVMITGSFTQLRAEGRENQYMTSQTRLENLMNNMEQSVRYTVPEVPETEVVSAEMEGLENLALIIEASLKYNAPAADGANAVSPELERLEMLAVTAEAFLKYQAPEVIEINSDAVENLLAENVTCQLR